MSSGTLSQEEISALLAGTDLGADDIDNEADAAAGATNERMETGLAANVGPTASEAKNQAPIPELTPMEKDALGEIANISMGTAATALSQLLGKKVEITTPKVDIAYLREIIDEYPIPHILIEVKYKRTLAGSNLLIISRRDGSVIVDLMMGGEGLNPTDQLNEIQISGIAEAMNQMMGSAATAMSTVFDSVIDISTPILHVSDNPDEDEEFISRNMQVSDPVVRVSFRMAVEGTIESNLLQIIPIPVAEAMVKKLMEPLEKASQAAPAAAVPPPAPPKAAEPVPPPVTPPPAAYGQQAAAQQAWYPPPPAYAVPPGYPPPGYGQTFYAAPPTTVQPAAFSQLVPGTIPVIPSNLDLIYDVPLQVSVELGRTSKTIREILDLGPGSVVELERLAGEPVDMAVNGKLIAKCEVVVINETFGIKITEIVNPSERLNAIH